MQSPPITPYLPEQNQPEHGPHMPVLRHRSGDNSSPAGDLLFPVHPACGAWRAERLTPVEPPGRDHRIPSLSRAALSPYICPTQDQAGPRAALAGLRTTPARGWSGLHNNNNLAQFSSSLAPFHGEEGEEVGGEDEEEGC